MEQITHGLGKRAQVYGPLVPKLDGLSCPGDIDVDDIKPCPYCSSETGEDKLATRDGEACWYDPDFTGEPCPSNKESTKHMLDKRSTKKLKWKYKGSTKTLPVVNYPSCGDAVDKDSIKKWYGYEVANVPCNPTIQKLSGQLSRSDFVTEHVYEAQSLKSFMLFLTGSQTRMPTGYSAASNAWVSEVRMGLGSGSRKHSAGSWNGRTMWEEMSVNIGSTKNPEGLVIADKGVNGKKQKFFEGSKPTAANDRNMKKTKLKHRSTAGVFSYMRNDDIWDIFTEASQGMVRVMHEFDESYKWGSENGEPKPPSRSGKQPTAGLRDLYCYWIDMELAKIEGTAGLWQTEAKAKFEAKYKARGSRDATNWLKMFSPGRPMGKDQLTFNRASNGHKKPSTNNPDIWKESNFAGLWRTGAGYGAAGPF